jgi:predicted DNA-binding transcriptional regulator AlpA
MKPQLEFVMNQIQAAPREELGEWLSAVAELQAVVLSRLATAPQLAPTAPIPEVLDVDQAAALIGMSRQWLYNNYARLPHIRIGGGKKPRLRFRRRDLDAWLAQHNTA